MSGLKVKDIFIDLTDFKPRQIVVPNLIPRNEETWTARFTAEDFKALWIRSRPPSNLCLVLRKVLIERFANSSPTLYSRSMSESMELMVDQNPLTGAFVFSAEDVVLGKPWPSDDHLLELDVLLKSG